MAAVLAQLRCYDMAARFQGAVVQALLEAGSDVREVDGALGSLAAYLDGLDNDVPARRLDLSTDSGLLSLRTASPGTARRMNELASQHHLRGRFREAIEWATRTTRYCDLFATEDDTLAALSADNLRRVGAWSAAAQVEAGLACRARLKGILASSAADVRIASEPGPVDRRLWCCSIRDFRLLIADLGRAGVPSSDVHTLAGHLRAKGIYPARDYRHRCQPRSPDIFITYDWRQNFIGLYDIIEGVLVYMGQAVRQVRADLDSARIRHLVFDEIGLWVDFVFIDQSVRDLGAEVREIIPRVIKASDVHLVLSDTALLRSWCCYELALFNKRPVAASRQHEIGGHLARPLRSFVTQEQAHPYGGFGQTATTAPEDKEAIEKYLCEEFPEGIAGVDLLLAQAGILDKRLTPEFAVPPAAEETMLAAVDRWLAR